MRERPSALFLLLPSKEKKGNGRAVQRLSLPGSAYCRYSLHENGLEVNRSLIQNPLKRKGFWDFCLRRGEAEASSASSLLLVEDLLMKRFLPYRSSTRRCV
jgi:hypothetical protein